MTTAEAREVLIRYNAWRRYDGPLEQTPLQPEPKEIGEAIDVAIGVLSKEEAEEASLEQKPVDKPAPAPKQQEIFDKSQEPLDPAANPDDLPF